jgi:hypothetical protein
VAACGINSATVCRLLCHELVMDLTMVDDGNTELGYLSSERKMQSCTPSETAWMNFFASLSPGRNALMVGSVGGLLLWLSLKLILSNSVYPEINSQVS